jgi:type I restriction enzyme S subunit
MAQKLYDLPEGWEWRPLGDVASLINGRAYKKHELLNTGPVPVLRVGNFFSNRSWYYSDLELPQQKYCDEGDLLYAWSASFGPKIWEGPRAIFHYHIWKIITSDFIDKHYLYWLLELDSADIKAQGNGVGMMHATKGGMEKRQIPLPPLNEQKRIVAKIDGLFTRIDTVIPHLQQTLELSKALFASETNIAFDQVSSKYGTSNLSKLVKINSGIALPKIFKDWKASGSISFYKVAQMNNDDRIMKDAAITFDSDVALAHRIKLFPKGSVLIPKRGGAILTDKKRLLLEDASYDSNIMGLKADEINITDEYLFRFLLSINLGDYIDTAVIPQINNKHIDQMQIPLAPIEAQKRIVAHLDALSERTHALESATQEKINDLTALKASLLDAAFKGKL